MLSLNKILIYTSQEQFCQIKPLLKENAEGARVCLWLEPDVIVTSNVTTGGLQLSRLQDEDMSFLNSQNSRAVLENIQCRGFNYLCK